MATINSVTAANSAASTSASATGLAANFETFITLLTAQLRAQDPLSPMDTKDFTNQLVQFTGVEQQMKTNTLLSALQQNFSLNAGSMAVSYLGKQATAITDLASLSNGSAKWTYDVPTGVSEVTLKVFDSNNRLVRSVSGNLSNGSHDFNWDGVSNSGGRSSDGQYQLVVEAKNTAGNSVTVPVTNSGIISDVDLSGTEPKVKINGTSVALSAITKITLASN
jgi:flagellar basal-body rod modification protein FlgD